MGAASSAARKTMHCSQLLQPLISSLKFLPGSHMSEAGASGVGLRCRGTARATFYYSVSLWATHRSEWTCPSISSSCLCRWKLGLEMTYAFTDLLQTGFTNIFMNFSM